MSQVDGLARTGPVTLSTNPLGMLLLHEKLIKSGSNAPLSVNNVVHCVVSEKAPEIWTLVVVPTTPLVVLYPARYRRFPILVSCSGTLPIFIVILLVSRLVVPLLNPTVTVVEEGDVGVPVTFNMSG